MENYVVKLVSNKVAKEMVKMNHYSHAWTMCKYALGLFRNSMMMGVAVYGRPVGRLAAQSIAPGIKDNEVLELTRLWIADSEGKNTESWFIGQTFKWLKKHDKNIKVLLSYSDLNAGHVGIIYQATNWIYQGRTQDTDAYKSHNKLIHGRTVFSKYGTRSIVKLEEMGVKIEKVKMEQKYRYLYILADKREKKKILKNLYVKPLPYEKIGE